MKKTILNALFFIYIVIAVFVTVCLLSFNDFKITEFGDNSLVIISNDNLEPDFNKGDLAIVNRSKEVLVGRKAFFYNTYNRKIEVSLGEITNIERVN